MEWAAYWKAMAMWGKATESLNPGERKFAFTLGKGIDEGWEFSERQAKWARTLWDRLRASFHPVMDMYIKKR